MKKTLVLRVHPETPNMKKILRAATLIRKGKLVAFPTETVYGLGADALDAEAMLDLFKAKQRPLDNPPIVHIFSPVDIYKLVKEIPSKAQELMEMFWPGPLTLIFKRSKIVPDVTVAGLDSIAVRIPQHKVALALIKESNCPVSAPSANLAGKPSPTAAKHVLRDLDGQIDAILDAGPTAIGIESTVLDLTVHPPQILRPGGISYETLKSVLGRVELNPAVTSQKGMHPSQTRSPGVKHKHYAPDAKLFVVEGELLAIVEKVNELFNYYKNKGNKVGIMCTDETSNRYSADVVKTLGSRSNLADVARNLFKLLREFDEEQVDVILSESVPTEELGLAIMNRLRKAAAYRIVKAEAFSELQA